jgi:hypothetical protein
MKKGADNFYSVFHIDEDMSDEDEYRFFMGRVFGRSFSLSRYRRTFEPIFKSIRAESMKELAEKLRPYADWEFDGYER